MSAGCRYCSIHSKRTRDELARAKYSHRTLGPAQTPLSSPCSFLKKGKGPRVQRPKSMHVHYRPPGYIRQLPAWEKRPRSASPGPIPPFPTDPVCLARTDFKKRNVEQVAKWARKPDRPRFVDTVKGDAHELLPSGLMPVYIYKKVRLFFSLTKFIVLWSGSDLTQSVLMYSALRRAPPASEEKTNSQRFHGGSWAREEVWMQIRD